MNHNNLPRWDDVRIVDNSLLWLLIFTSMGVIYLQTGSTIAPAKNSDNI